MKWPSSHAERVGGGGDHEGRLGSGRTITSAGRRQLLLQVGCRPDGACEAATRRSGPVPGSGSLDGHGRAGQVVEEEIDGKTNASSAAAAGVSERQRVRGSRGALPSRDEGRRGDGGHARIRSRRCGRATSSRCSRPTSGACSRRTTVSSRSSSAGTAKRTAQAQLRTLQRRHARLARAARPGARRCIFEQRHVAGREAAIDFTHARSSASPIAGEAFAHLLFEFVLSFSDWTWVRSRSARRSRRSSAGVQGALWELGGVPDVLRSDNLSAATHELERSGGRDLNRGSGPCSSTTALESTRISRASRMKTASPSRRTTA